MLEVEKSSCNGYNCLHIFFFFFKKEDTLLLIFSTPETCTLVAGEYSRKGKGGSRREDPFMGSLLVGMSSVRKYCFWRADEMNISRTYSIFSQWHDISSFGWTPFFVSLLLAGNLQGWVRKGTPPIPTSKDTFWAAVFNKESPCVLFSWKVFIRKSLMKIKELISEIYYLISLQLSGKWLDRGNWISGWNWLKQTATWWMLAKECFCLH